MKHFQLANYIIAQKLPQNCWCLHQLLCLHGEIINYAVCNKCCTANKSVGRQEMNNFVGNVSSYLWVRE